MRANPDFILKNIGDIYFIMAKEPEDFPSPGNMLTTNETGAYLWNQLQTDSSMEELTEALCLLYGIDTATASEDISAFLQQLKKTGALLH